MCFRVALQPAKGREFKDRKAVSCPEGAVVRAQKKADEPLPGADESLKEIPWVRTSSSSSFSKGPASAGRRLSTEKSEGLTTSGRAASQSGCAPSLPAMRSSKVAGDASDGPKARACAVSPKTSRKTCKRVPNRINARFIRRTKLVQGGELHKWSLLIMVKFQNGKTKQTIGKAFIYLGKFSGPDYLAENPKPNLPLWISSLSPPCWC